MVLGMADALPQIVLCPPELTSEALALVLREVRVDHRRELAQSAQRSGQAGPRSDPSLFVALQQGSLCGAAWGQRQPGNVAVLWPPQLLAGQAEDGAVRLAQAVVAALDAGGIDLTQVLLSRRDAKLEAVLHAADFVHLTELQYLTCEAASFPASPPDERGLEFEPYRETQYGRLKGLIERTYEGTQDCPQLNDARQMDDVLDGYRATGEYRPERWLFARAAGQDVGILLLAQYPQSRQIELVYMGVIPEARGSGWGGALAQRALWMARCAAMERVLLAVDVENKPALAIYRQSGFHSWDLRTIFVRVRKRPRT
jgi:mycothiol synthase